MNFSKLLRSQSIQYLLCELIVTTFVAVNCSNIIERAVVIAPTDEITVECLRSEVSYPELARQMMRDSEGSSEEIDIARGTSVRLKCDDAEF